MKEACLSYCKSQIEQRLDWGHAESWTSQDFEELSMLIQEKTGRVISSTTLKRIWGACRLSKQSEPAFA